MKNHQRDPRVRRAVTEVLAKYQFTRTDVGDEARFAVTGGFRPYTLTLSKTWAFPAKCSCDDKEKLGDKDYCKHAMAVMMQNDDLRCQLLEVYL